MQAPCPSSSPSASSTPSSAGCCATAWTRSRASAPRSTSRPRCSCSTTPPRTGRPTSRASTPSTTEVIALDERRGKGRQRLRRCCGGRAGASACCSTRTPSSSPARPPPCTPRSPSDERAGAAGRDARPPRRRAAAVGVALPLARHRADDGAVPAPAARGAEHAATTCARSTGCSRRRCSSAARPRPRSASSTRSSSSTPTRSTSAGGCATRAGTRSTCPGARAVHHEQLSTGNVPDAADRRVLPQPRPLHAQAPLGASRPRSCAT